ncbi:acetyltransferase [Devosia faecipullorum]|uniref:acetyltransferase n=1 Tax=Devosia faecipullorum TaxID=2755039 RepID=UPI00187B5264|nr:acetyltransferase [Devosia faecipullorum]MBE7734178.1 acetyltransferase [Devosia faecipullorum]
MFKLRTSTNQDLARVLDIWRSAVDATHDFLAREDRVAIEAEVVSFFPHVNFVLASDEADVPQGFMFLHDGHLEALFVAPEKHGLGIGKLLIGSALRDNPGLTTDVNEQNQSALGFYEHQGFERTGRSPVDGQGRPYPLIHLRHR